VLGVYCSEGLEELGVVALVEGFGEGRERWKQGEDGVYFGGGDDLCVGVSVVDEGDEGGEGRERGSVWKRIRRTNLILQINPSKAHHPTQHAIPNQLLILNQLRRRKRTQRIDEALRSFSELTDGDVMESFVDFQAISPIPVTTFFDESFGRGE
jgi:hypothetical protein